MAKSKKQYQVMIKEMSDALDKHLAKFGIKFSENLSIDDFTILTLSKELINIGENVFSGCNNLAEILVDEQNPVFASVEGVLYNKNRTKLIKYPQGKEGEYIIPDTVIEIENNAFEDCKGLTALTLPMSLQYIGNGAFKGCSHLETITLSRNTKTGYKAFEGFSGKLIYRE